MFQARAIQGESTAANHDLAAANTLNHLRRGVDGDLSHHRRSSQANRLLKTAESPAEV